jgi:hypothetical protein
MKFLTSREARRRAWPKTALSNAFRTPYPNERKRDPRSDSLTSSELFMRQQPCPVRQDGGRVELVRRAARGVLRRASREENKLDVDPGAARETRLPQATLCHAFSVEKPTTDSLPEDQKASFFQSFNNIEMVNARSLWHG